MSTVPVTIVTPGLFTVLIGLADPPTEDVTCDVAAYVLQANPVTVTIPASFCADGYDDVTSQTRAIVLTVLCKWDDPASLAWFLDDNKGAIGYLEVRKTAAAVGKGPGWSAAVRLVTPEVNLSTGAASQTDVTLPVIGGLTPLKPDPILPFAAAAEGNSAASHGVYASASAE